MPSREAHLRQADRNEALCGDLQSASRYTEWQVTTLFYAALHYVDAYFATQSTPVHPGSHEVRDKLVRAERFLRAIYGHYEELRNRSVDARYNLTPFPPGQVTRLRTDHYDPVRSHVRSLLRLPP